MNKILILFSLLSTNNQCFIQVSKVTNPGTTKSTYIVAFSVYETSPDILNKAMLKVILQVTARLITIIIIIIIHSYITK